MALNNYLFLEGIKDEETDSDHKEWITVFKYAWGVHQPASHDVGSLGTGKATWEPLTVGKKVSLSSPTLMLKCATNEYIKTGKLHVCRMINNKNETVMEYMLSDIIICGVESDSTNASDGLPFETVSLACAKVEWKYVAFDRNNKKVGNNGMIFDIKNNKKG